MKLLFVSTRERQHAIWEGMARLYDTDTFTFAKNAREALEAMGREVPDVVLWKVTILDPAPGECAWDEYVRFAHQVRSERQWDRVPLLLVGSFDGGHGGGLVKHGLKNGFDGEINPHMLSDRMNLLRLLGSLTAPPPAKLQALLVEPDDHQALPYTNALTDAGFLVKRKRSAGAAIKAITELNCHVVILDVMMSGGRSFSAAETAGGFKTGLVLARRIRSNYPMLPIVALTYSADPEVAQWFGSSGSLYLHKDYVKPPQAARMIKRLLKVPGSDLNVFIVHGRATERRAELQSYIRDHLRLGQPIVLADQPSHGMTIIEKFERYGHEADIVFVLLTPDDMGHLATESKDARHRARQNVIFEFGYFLGLVRRRAARVVLLKEGQLELPSDVHGMVFIDISGGIWAADASIRTELGNWL